MINKINSIRVSERVFDILGGHLDYLKDNSDYDMDYYLQTFNNCREQGYYLTFYCNGKFLYVWAYENRNSDNIVVVKSDKYPTNNGMFDDEAWENRIDFPYNGEHTAAEKILKMIKEYFNIED